MEENLEDLEDVFEIEGFNEVKTEYPFTIKKGITLTKKKIDKLSRGNHSIKNIFKIETRLSLYETQHLIRELKSLKNVELKGKKVIIVDDTIVRGNVIGSIIENLRNIGVSEVHVRIPAPPVVERCILGISIQHKKELIATNRNVKEVSKKINADSLSYLSLYDISDMVPPKSYNLCFSGYVDKNIISYSNEYLQKNGFNNKNGPSQFL